MTLTEVTALNPIVVAGLEATMLQAPRIVPRATWHLVAHRHALLLVDEGAAASPEHDATVSHGMAAEFLVLGLHGLAMGATVEFRPEPEGKLVAHVFATPSARPSKVDTSMLLAAREQRWPSALRLPTPGRPITAYQRDVLELATAGFHSRVGWNAPISPDAHTAVLTTAGDTAADWFNVGRATAHLLVRAATLGLRADLVTPSLRDPDVRVSMHNMFVSGAWPQLLLNVYQR